MSAFNLNNLDFINNVFAFKIGLLLLLRLRFFNFSTIYLRESLPKYFLTEPGAKTLSNSVSALSNLLSSPSGLLLLGLAAMGHSGLLLLDESELIFGGISSSEA